MGSKRKFYVVRRGHVPGIYTDWAAVQEQVNGFPNAEHKSFSTLQEAEAYAAGGPQPPAAAPGPSRAAAPPPARAAGRAAAPAGGGRGRGKFYAIKRGHQTGVFQGTWDEVKRLVEKYPGALYRGFPTEAEALEWLGPAPQPTAAAPAAAAPAGAAAGGGAAAARGAGVKRRRASTEGGGAAAVDGEGEYSGAEEEMMVTVSFDGASRDNPGRAGYGYVVVDRTTKERLFSGCRALPAGTTNNEAEYQGLIAGLERALRLGARHIVAEGDSQLVVRQVNKEYRCRDSKLQPLMREAVRLMDKFDSAELRHVYREENSAADDLANLAVDVDESVAAVGQESMAGGARGRREVVAILANKWQIEGSPYEDDLLSAPVLLDTAIPLLARLMDDSPQEEVEARMRAAGWTESTGGPPDPADAGGFEEADEEEGWPDYEEEGGGGQGGGAGGRIVDSSAPSRNPASSSGRQHGGYAPTQAVGGGGGARSGAGQRQRVQQRFLAPSADRGLGSSSRAISRSRSLVAAQATAPRGRRTDGWGPCCFAHAAAAPAPRTLAPPAPRRGLSCSPPRSSSAARARAVLAHPSPPGRHRGGRLAARFNGL